MGDKLKFWGLLFLVTGQAHALEDPNFTPKQKKLLADFAETIAYAKEHMPPCEGMDRISEAVFRFSPAKSCTKSLVYQEYFEKFDRIIRANCKELARWTDEAFHGSQICSAPNLVAQQPKVKQALYQMRKAAYSEMEIWAEERRLFQEDFDEGPAGKAFQAENKRSECAFSLTLGMQLRKSQLEISNTLYGHADEAADSACDSRTDSREQFFEYLRKGPDSFAIQKK